MRQQLEIEDLVAALKTFGDRYEAVDVFADDLSKSAQERVLQQATLEQGGQAYRFTVFKDRGVIRLERVRPDNSGSAMLTGAALGAAIAVATKQRGEGVIGGALLGLLVGGLLGSDTEPVRKVFAMELDPASRSWMAYDGALLRWMKDRLLPPTQPIAKF